MVNWSRGEEQEDEVFSVRCHFSLTLVWRSESEAQTFSKRTNSNYSATFSLSERWFNIGLHPENWRKHLMFDEYFKLTFTNQQFTRYFSLEQYSSFSQSSSVIILSPSLSKFDFIRPVIAPFRSGDWNDSVEVSHYQDEHAVRQNDSLLLRSEDSFPSPSATNFWTLLLRSSGVAILCLCVISASYAAPWNDHRAEQKDEPNAGLEPSTFCYSGRCSKPVRLEGTSRISTVWSVWNTRP